MGGRGSSSGSDIKDGSGRNITVLSTDNLISRRERYQKEVDETLTVLRHVNNEFGVIVDDAHVAKLAKKDQAVMAYYDREGNIAVNEAFFDNAKIEAAYDSCVRAGFHPSRGDNSAMQAVIAHEMGHRINDVIAQNAGRDMDRIAGVICRSAASKLGIKGTKALAAKISGYAKESHTETIAEAYADVYCNGSNASAASRAVVAELKSWFKNK